MIYENRQNDKTKEKRWDALAQKEKSNARKNNIKIWGIKPESTGERRKIKKISTKGKTIQRKKDIPKTTKENSTDKLGGN